MQKKEKERNEQISFNKNALIAGILNLILVGLGYVYIKQYLRAILSFLGFVVAYFIIFYVASFVPILVWLGLPIVLFFVYDAYKRGENSKNFLFRVS